MRLERSVRPAVRSVLQVVTITLASIVLLFGMAVEYACFATRGRSKDELAAIQVDKLRTSSLYWLVQNPSARCPRIQDLDPDATDEDLRDPWGHLVIMACDVHDHVIVRSNGEDGRPGTDDDVVSR